MIDNKRSRAYTKLFWKHEQRSVYTPLHARPHESVERARAFNYFIDFLFLSLDISPSPPAPYPVARYTYVILHCTRNYNIIYKIITRAYKNLPLIRKPVTTKLFRCFCTYIYIRRITVPNTPSYSPSPSPSPNSSSSSCGPAGALCLSSTIYYTLEHIIPISVRYLYHVKPNLYTVNTPVHIHTHQASGFKYDIGGAASSVPSAMLSPMSRVCRHYPAAILRYTAIFKDSKTFVEIIQDVVSTKFAFIFPPTRINNFAFDIPHKSILTN